MSPQFPRPKSSRRSRRRHAEARQQLIAFPLQGETFAVPIGLVNRVVAVEARYHDLAQDSPRLLPYVDRQITAICLSQWVFPARQAQLTATGKSPATGSHMLVVQSANYELVGLLVTSPPALIRVATSAFAPVPAAFLQRGHVRYIGALVNRAEQAPIFLISIGELLGQLYAPPEPVLLQPIAPNPPPAISAPAAAPNLLPGRLGTSD